MAAPQRNDALAQLAKLPPAKKAGLLFVVMAALGFLYWQFLYSGLKSDRESEEAKTGRLQSTQADLRKKDKELNCKKGLPGCKEDGLKEQQKQLKSSLKGIKLALPSEPELASFIEKLQLLAGVAGVEWRGHGQLKEAAVSKYIKVPMSVAVEGTFYQLISYFEMLGPRPKKVRRPGDPDPGDTSAVEKAEGLDRIVTIEDLELTPAVNDTNQIRMSAKFVAATFRQPKAAPKPGAKKPGAKKPGAKKPGAKTPGAKTPGAKKPGAKRGARPAGVIGATKRDIKAAKDKRKDFVKDATTEKKPGAPK